MNVNRGFVGFFNMCVDAVACYMFWSIIGWWGVGAYLTGGIVASYQQHAKKEMLRELAEEDKELDF